MHASRSTDVRYLALDVGDRRIGLAVGDDTFGLSRALPTLRRSRRQADDIERLRAIATAEEVGALLIGLPLHRPVSFLARDTLFSVPVIGWILRHTYVMPLSRDTGGAAGIRETIRRLDEGFLVGLFEWAERCRSHSQL